MRILVAVQSYPNPSGGAKLMYVHVRNRYYVEHGIDVDVLNFSTEREYELDGVRVIPLSSLERKLRAVGVGYDVLVCHAANLRSHYRFLRKHGERFPRFVFFFHGHEIIDVVRDYPKEYPYVGKSGMLYELARSAYDRFKLAVWSRYFPKVAHKSDFVFVSHFIEDVFYRNLRASPEIFVDRMHVINNSISRVFEERSYTRRTSPSYDFVTIRSSMDGAKYCMDAILSYALRFPNMRFLVVGKGRFFEHYEKPANITWIEGPLRQDEIPDVLNEARCGLMLTRQDTQGVMACEMASFGIPVITSAIPVCYEIFSKYPNVALVDNFEPADLPHELEKLERVKERNKLYIADDTVAKEVGLLLKGGKQ